jgi:GGDEF domain-containing protein
MEIASTQLALSGRRPNSINVINGEASCERSGCRPLEQLVQEADLALYRAKAAGRDCVHVAHDQPTAALACLLQPSMV